MRVFHHQLVDLDYRAQAEVVGPAIQHLVELRHFVPSVPQTRPSIRPLTDRPTQLADFLHSRTRPQVGPARLTRVVTSERVPQECERIVRQATPPRLLLV